MIKMDHILLIVVLSFGLIWAPAAISSQHGDLNACHSGWFGLSSAEDEGVNPLDLKKFSDVLTNLVTENKIVGCEILIIKNRKILIHDVYGWSDIEREKSLQKNSIYRIRSMTKPFIGTAILMLAEEGKLALDDPAGQYLPSFQNKKSGKITIRHLLKHTSGFRQDDFPSGYWHRSTLRDAVDLIGGIGPPSLPDDVFRYSDKNTATMGAIIAEITGEPAEHFIQRRILDPLGMKDTFSYFSPEYPWAQRMNSTYRLDGDRYRKYWDNTQHQETPFFRASGGLYTTVCDYARFLSVWTNFGAYESGTLLKKETIKNALKMQSSGTEYGLHWEVFDTFDQTKELPPFGHRGSDGTFAISIPEKNILVLYFTQSNGTSTIKENILPLIKSIFF